MGKTSIENKLTRRILIGWNTSRIIMLVIGLVYLVASIVDFTMIGLFFSLFIVGQAVLGLGCAAGNCPVD